MQLKRPLLSQHGNAEYDSVLAIRQSGKEIFERRRFVPRTEEHGPLAGCKRNDTEAQRCQSACEKRAARKWLLERLAHLDNPFR
jgi:hypothetical protein